MYTTIVGYSYAACVRWQDQNQYYELIVLLLQKLFSAVFVLLLLQPWLAQAPLPQICRVLGALFDWLRKETIVERNETLVEPREDMGVAC